MSPDSDVPWSQAPAQARHDRIGSLFVDRTIERRIHDVLDAIRAKRMSDPEPSNVLITGDTGVGKSEILSTYLAREANRTTRLPCGRIHRPVFSVEIRNGATPRSTAVDMLKMLGLVDKRFHVGSVPELTGRLKHQMIEQGVELCTMDEFNNTLSDDGRVRSYKVAMWIKDLCKSKTRDGDAPKGRRGENIPFAMFGTPKSERIVDPSISEELASLTPFRMTIDRYAYDTPEARAEFRTFLDDLDQELPFDEFSSIGVVDAKGLCPLADKIHVVTYGLLRPLGYLIREAARLAIDEGAPHVCERHLHESVERQRGLLQSSLLVDDKNSGRTVVNPFTVPSRAQTARPTQKSGWKAAA